jgi:hypothetical protein
MVTGAHLLLHEWESPNLLDDLVGQPVDDPVANVTALVSSRLIRLDLNWKYAWGVIDHLRKIGLSADLVYPSEEGLARFAADQALGSDLLRITSDGHGSEV